MKRNTILLVTGLLVAFLIVAAERRNIEIDSPPPERKEYKEYASVLWKAHVYPERIDFVVDDRVIHTIQFGISERHVDSVSYRNLNGYFDPVLVTVWRSGKGQKAVIVDPVAKSILAEVNSEHEVDVSVSDDNRIVLAVQTSNESGDATPEDNTVVWPGQRN